MSEMTIQVEKRERTGKGGSRESRRKGMIPGVVYGLGSEPKAVSVNWRELRSVLDVLRQVHEEPPRSPSPGLASLGDLAAQASRTASDYAHAVRLLRPASAEWQVEVRKLTGGAGVDVVLDIIGGDYLQRNIDCLHLHGRLVQVGLIGGARAQINLRPVLNNRLTLTGSTLRPRTVEEKGAIARELEQHVWPLLARGEVKPIVHATFPLGEVAEAHRMLEAGEVIGKLVLTVG